MAQQAATKQRIKRIRLEDALNANVWDVDTKPHIIVDSEKCAGCADKACTYLCPGGCFTLLAGKVLYSYEGCLECGTCRVVCPKGAVTWNYPLSGRGVQYRFG
ncbi:MAG: 4Fe-4S ferredoxin [Candidatus Terraquivivens tikiterensis]|uniref:4Fe-4S ferredoxin n=1 Tax=Candidatus Terraquivivens tikiterensis TaxID=1980982 RepID=A0A2R7Y0F3_9ARCH|nr:MAG: 4Fe-4S ferredoxin [Candidatus Terraquivivens tikiterensis]